MKYYFFTLISLTLIARCGIINAQNSADSSSYNKFTKDFLFVPIVIKSPETKWGLGYASSYFFKIKKEDTLTRTSNIESIGLITMRKQLIFMLGANLFSPNEKYIFRIRNTFSRFPDKFWGIGDNTPKSNLESYAFDQFFSNPQLLRKIFSKVYVGIIWELQIVYNMHYQKNKLFDNTVIRGKDGGISSGLGILLAWDTRNNAFSPDKGAFVQFSMLKFSPLILSEYQFTNTVIDIRKYISLRRKQVLAFQAYGSFATGAVPYRYLASHGGSDNMRGYYAGRYRDNSQIYIQAEYRIPIWKRIGMVVFAGIGDISNRVLIYRFQPIKYTLGSGLRIALKPKEKLNLRLDFGIGHQSFASYVTVTEAF
ncbi:MAG: hypothetical protein EAZ07_00760 [Cytophagales bacterium]|nr:MAG: hypothetical protein EAZ07_00760 [Cytophagales bacterium]